MYRLVEKWNASFTCKLAHIMNGKIILGEFRQNVMDASSICTDLL